MSPFGRQSMQPLPFSARRRSPSWVFGHLDDLKLAAVGSINTNPKARPDGCARQLFVVRSQITYRQTNLGRRHARK